MSTQHTPQDVRQGAAAAAATPPVLAMNQDHNVVMSPAQLERLITNCNKSEAADDEAHIGSVAVKLPTFWTHDPDLWFLQAEAVFTSRQPAVTRDGTKFNHVVTTLPADALNAIKKVIRLPATTPDRYQQLKTTLLLTYGKTQAEKYKELIQFAAAKEPITDQKPSSLLMYIQDLLGNSKEEFERQILLNRMPEAFQTALSTSTAVSNEDFAKEANKVMQSYLLARNASTPSVSAVSFPDAVSFSDDGTFAAPDVAAVSRPGQPPLCFTHARYGSRAFSCRSSRCPMRGQVQPKPSGNGPAGRPRAGRQ